MTKVTHNSSEEFIEAIHRQEEFSYILNFLRGKEVSHNETNFEVLALPFLAALNTKLIIHYLLQCVVQDCEESFLASLDALLQIEERYQSQKPLSLYEKIDLENFSASNPEHAKHSNAIFLESITANFFESYLKELIGNFFLRVSFKEKTGFFTIYRKESFYSLIDINFIYIKNINNLNILIQILKHQDFDKFGELTIAQQIINPNLIVPEIITEISRLKAQDKTSELLHINGYPISRVFLYELGATIEEYLPTARSNSSQLINSKMNLKQTEIDNLLHHGKFSISAESIITYIERCIKINENTNLINILLINRILDKFHLTGEIDKVNRVMRIQEIIPAFNLTDLPKQLEPYLDFNFKRITRKIKTFRENVRNLEYVNAFISRDAQLLKFRLEFGKLCVEFDYSKVSDDQFFFSIAELVYIQHQNPIVLAWKNILENKLGYLNYVASAATFRKIKGTLNPYYYQSIYSQPLKNTLKWILQTPFDVIRIIQSSYRITTNSVENDKDMRDSAATIIFSSSSISEVVISDVLKKSPEFSIGVFTVLTGLEMSYRGISELEANKNCSLTFNENLNIYLHSALSLPNNPSLEMLKQRIKQVQNLQKKAEHFLNENENAVYAVALGKLRVSYNLVKPKPKSIAVEINRGRYFERQNISMELIPDYAFIQLNQESPIALSEFLSRLAPDDANAKWSLICGPIYQEDKIYDPPEARKKIVTAIYYCNNAFVISNNPDKDFSQTTFYYDLLLQDSGAVITSDVAKENIYFIKEGIQEIIFFNSASNVKNTFYITGNFTGALVNKEDVSNQTNIINCSSLKNKQLEFAKGFFYLNLRHSKYFKSEGITHFNGRENLADHIDCAASTIRFVASAGGETADRDLIKNCPSAHIDSFTSLSANVQGNYVYYINKKGKFINLEQHNGTIDLHFKSLDLIHDTCFFFNFKEETLEIREKNSKLEYIVRIKFYAYLNTKKTVKLYNKDSFLLEPVTDNFEEISEEDKSKFIPITNYVFKTISFLSENFMILEEYHNLISNTDGIALFGIISQIQSREMDLALKIIGSNTINVVIPLGVKNIDYVYGGLGEDIYYLRYEDLKSSLLFSESKIVHINNLAEDNAIDCLVLPVWTHELLIKKFSFHLMIEFVDFSNYKLIVDDYFRYPTQQHLLLIDRIGREWIFKLSTNLTWISMVPYLSDFTKQLKYPFNAGNEKNYLSIAIKFSSCLYFRDSLGLTLECTTGNNLPLQIPLYKFCQADKNNLKLFSSANAALIYEEQIDAIDCLSIRAQRYLAFNRKHAVETVRKKIYYGLDPLKPHVIAEDSTNGSVKRQLFIDDVAIYCQIKSWNETELVFKFLNHEEDLLGVFIVEEWDAPNNRISVIENTHLYVSGLEKWGILAVDKLTLYVTNEFLKAYIKQQAIIDLKKSIQLFESLESLLLLLLMTLNDQNTVIDQFTIHELVFDLKKVQEGLRVFLKNNAISKKALVNTLVWVCLNTSQICEKVLPGIIRPLLLPIKDEKLLKNLFIYLNFFLNNTQVTISGYSSLEKMIDAIIATGWNMSLQKTINGSQEIYLVEARPQSVAHNIYSLEQEKYVVSKKFSNLAVNKTGTWSNWLCNRGVYFIGGAAATISAGFFGYYVGALGFTSRFFGRRFGSRLNYKPKKIVNFATTATFLEMTHRTSKVEGCSIDKRWTKLLAENEEVAKLNKTLNYQALPDLTKLPVYPIQDFLLLANIAVRSFNRA